MKMQNTYQEDFVEMWKKGKKVEMEEKCDLSCETLMV